MRVPWTEATVVARAYLKWGDEFPQHMSGDFAVALWDRRHRRLIACRDPFGVKSLFYRREPRGIWLSRDQQALLRTFDRVPAINDDRVVEHLLWTFSATNRTFFREIYPVPPGQTVVFRQHATETRAYWTPPPANSDRKPSQPTVAFLEQFDDLFRRSVANRLSGCSAAAVHVSGGVDSSVMALAADQMRSLAPYPPQLIGANAIYPGLACDETPYAEALGEKLHFPVKRWDGTQSIAVDVTTPAMDGPAFRSVFVNGTIGDIEIARSQRASVILDGTGGDELTVGLGTVKDMLAHGEWTRALRRVVLYSGPGGRKVLSRLRQVAGQYLPIGVKRYRTIRRLPAPPWLTASSAERVADIVAGPPFEILDSAASTHVWRRLTSPQLICGVDYLQRQAAPFGIEYRFPFLDRNLARLVVSAAAAYWPLRTRPHQRVFYGQLPEVVRTRSSKADMTPAFANRIRRAAPLIDRQFSDGIWASENYVVRDAALTAWRSFNASTADGIACRRIWSIVTLEAWLRRIFGYIPSP